MKRPDGIRLKNVDPMYRVACHVMDKRYDAMNMITIDIPLDPIKAYLKDAKRRGHNLSHMGVILAAYTRTVAEFPGLNRFIMNKEPYAHKDFKVGMVVLKDGSMETHGTMSKITFELTDTIHSGDSESTGAKRLLYSCIVAVTQKIYLEKSLEAIAAEKEET